MEKEPSYNREPNRPEDYPDPIEVAPLTFTEYEATAEPVSLVENSDVIENRERDLDAIRADIGTIYNGGQVQELIPDEVEQESAPYDDEDAMKDLIDLGLSRKFADKYLDVQYNYSLPRGKGLKLSREGWLNSDFINNFFEESQLPAEKREAFSKLAVRIYDGLYPQSDALIEADRVAESETPEQYAQQEKSIDRVSEEQEARRDRIDSEEARRDTGRVISRLEEAKDQITRLTHRLIAFADYDNGRLANEGVIRKTRQNLDDITLELGRSRKSNEDLDPVMRQAVARLHNIDLQSWTRIDDVVKDLRSVNKTVGATVDELKSSRNV